MVAIPIVKKRTKPFKCDMFGLFDRHSSSSAYHLGATTQIGTTA